MNIKSELVKQQFCEVGGSLFAFEDLSSLVMSKVVLFDHSHYGKCNCPLIVKSIHEFSLKNWESYLRSYSHSSSDCIFNALHHLTKLSWSILST